MPDAEQNPGVTSSVALVQLVTIQIKYGHHHTYPHVCHGHILVLLTEFYLATVLYCLFYDEIGQWIFNTCSRH